VAEQGTHKPLVAGSNPAAASFFEPLPINKRNRALSGSLKALASNLFIAPEQLAKATELAVS
jgi:hypothetical protein